MTNIDNKKIKIGLVSTLGGHLEQIYQLKTIYLKHDYFFITSKGESNISPEDIKEKMYFIIDINERRGIKNPFRLIIALIQIIYIFLKEKPDLIISTGSGIAVPAFIISKLFLIKTIFIESYTRIKKPSISGRVCYYFSNLYFAQHHEICYYFKKAIYVGSLYDNI